MSIAVIEKQETTLNVSPEGRLDAIRTPALENEILPYLEDTDRIVMDFSKVEFISSACFRLLMLLEQSMENRGGEVQVVRANEEVLHIIDVAGFANVVRVIGEGEEGTAP